MEIVTNNMSGKTQAPGNLFRCQSLVVGHLKNRTLPRLKPFEHLLCEANGLRRLPGKGPAHTHLDRGLEVLPAVEVVRDKVPLSVQRPVISVLQEPHFKHALALVEI